MKNVRKMIALLLAVCMLFALTACGKVDPADDPKAPANDAKEPANQGAEEKSYFNETGLRICDEPITITVSGSQGYTSDWNDNAMTRFFRDEMGIIFDCTPYAPDAFASQYALMLANDEQPDLIVNAQDKVSKAQVDIDGAAGYWLDISQYLDLMPNFVRVMEENPAWASYLKTETGAIYSLNWFKAAETARIGGNIFVNKEHLAGAGITEEIKTLDDFYNALVAVKAAYPELTPLGVTPTTGWTEGVERILRGAFGIHGFNSSNTYSYLLDFDENDEAFLHDITDNNREYLKFMNKLYEEGMLDPECFIMTPQEYRAKEFEAHQFVFFSDSGFNYPSQGEPTNFEWIPALTTEEYPESTYTLMNQVMDGTKVMISADTKYPEAICRLIDYMFTEEGLWLGASVGIEGVTYDLVENEYDFPMFSFENYWDKDNYENSSSWVLQEINICQGLSFFNGADRIAFDGMDPDTIEKMAYDTNLDLATRTYAYMNLILNTKVDNIISARNPLIYNNDELQERNTLFTDLDTYLKTAYVAFISGEKDIENDADWTEFIDTVNQIGYERLMAIESAAYSRQK